MITENYRFNNDQTITTEIGQFLVEQRNAGFVDNDGHWIVSKLRDLYWSQVGTLVERRPGKYLGAFATPAEADAAIASAEIQPEHTPFHKSLN